MRRLVLAFAGRTYHIVGNLMSRFDYSKNENIITCIYFILLNVLGVFPLS